MWSEPDQPIGRIQYYNIVLTQNGKIIHTTTTINKEWKPKFRLKYSEVFNVSVSTMTNTVGTPVYATVNITDTCKLPVVCTTFA